MRIRLVGLSVAVATAAAAATTFATGSTWQVSGPTVTIDGRTVPVQRAHPTVDSVVRSAGLSAPPGMLYSVVSHRPLGPDPGISAEILVDGHRAARSSPVRAGDRVALRRGSAVEATVLRTLMAGTQRAEPPDVERYLWHPGSSGHQSELVGERSGEVVGTARMEAATPPVQETDKVVALTFDDGPNPTWTPQVLQILQAKQVQATFCDVGRWATAYPELVRAEVAEGNTVCDHTVDHDTTLDRAPHDRVAYELGSGADLIVGAAGVRPSFYRPPAGILSPDVVATAHARGMRVITWSVDPSDYLMPPPYVLLSRILSQVSPGAIILLHDGGGFRANTVAVLPMLIDTLRAQGYRFTTPYQNGPTAQPGDPSL